MSHLKRSLISTAASVVLLTAIGATAGAQAVDPADVQAALEEARVRLGLSAEQEAALKPIFAERNARLKAIRDKHAGDDSRRARRKMFKDARPVMDDYQARVRAILDDSQEAEWEKMRAEAKARLKEQYKANQGPS
jgi:hypothetical protein